MIDVNPNHLETITRILAGHVPECEVRAFGSRVTWTAKDYSDLDLAVVGERALESGVLRRLKEAFEESDLPFRVDLLDWHAISPAFRRVIETRHEIVQKGKQKSLGLAGRWTTAALGELCEFRAGSVFKPAFQGQTSGSYPFVKVSDMNLPANAVRIQDANNWVSEQDLRDLRARPFPAGTVVFAKIGEALRQNRLRQVARETVVDNNMMGAVPRTASVEPRFFYYALSKFDFSDIAQGTALPYLTISALSGLTIEIPPLAEQRAIAHILGALDDKIELNRRMSETLEAMARALFKSWFVDFDAVRAKAEGRDPGLPQPLADLFPDAFEDSALGEIPVGWQAVRFGGVVEQLRDQENPLSSTDALFHHFSIPAFDAGQSPKPEHGESIKSHKSRVPAGTVLLSKLNPEIERVWLVDVRPSERAVCSTEFLVLRARTPFTRSFVYCLARSPLFRQQIEGLVTGTSKSHQRAQVDSILNLAVVVPPSSMSVAFDRSADSLLVRTLDCRRESRTLTALRDTLLPKLISGELRVPSILARGRVSP